VPDAEGAPGTPKTIGWSYVEEAPGVYNDMAAQRRHTTGRRLVERA
jgi:hypothetical protein